VAEPILFDWFDHASFPTSEDLPISDALRRKLKDWAREGDNEHTEEIEPINFSPPQRVVRRHG
jgi:hypothetical protein